MVVTASDLEAPLSRQSSISPLAVDLECCPNIPLISGMMHDVMIRTTWKVTDSPVVRTGNHGTGDFEMEKLNVYSSRRLFDGALSEPCLHVVRCSYHLYLRMIL